MRKYNVNDKFFEQVDNEHKAYWLGFLMADGHINKREGQDRLVLTTSSKDFQHLYKYVDSLGFEGTVKHYEIKVGTFKGYKFSNVQITSQKMVDDLAKYGCVKKKSLMLEFPKSLIPDHLIHHFIRGYFDGDGSVFISMEKHWRNKNIFPVIHFRFTGTEQFLKQVQSEINLGGNLKKPKGDNVYELSFKRNKKAADFYNYLYKNATIYLDRKKEKFEVHLKEKCSETTIG